MANLKQNQNVPFDYGVGPNTVEIKPSMIYAVGMLFDPSPRPQHPEKALAKMLDALRQAHFSNRKWFSDGAVHHYFNPYGSPYEAFLNYMNVLSDFLIRVNEYAENQLLQAAKAPLKPAKSVKEKASSTTKIPAKKEIKAKTPVSEKPQKKAETKSRKG